MQPNIVLFAPDDLGREQLKAMGFDNSHTEVFAPRIAGLIQDGVLFKRAYTQPWCSPTRAAWQTGRYGFKTGIGSLAEHEQQPLLASEICLPAALDLATGNLYAKACIGKWHLSDFASRGGEIEHPITCGFDYWAGTLRNLEAGDTYFSWQMSSAARTPSGIVTKQARVEEYLPLWNVQAALDWIASVQQPFFLYLPINLPHGPLHRPPAATYDTATYVLPDAYPSTGATQAQRNAYLKAMVQTLDFCLGAFLDGLPQAVRANTLVFWWSDNGTSSDAANVSVTTAPWSVNNPSSGDVQAHLKRTVKDGGCNTPLVVSGPGVKSPGRTSTDLVSCVDLFATLIDAAQGNPALVPLPSGGTRDSISFWPVLNQATAGTRTKLLLDLFGPNGPHLNATTSGSWALTYAQYKLSREGATGVTGFPVATLQGGGTYTGNGNANDVFVDLAADPYEGTNLIAGAFTLTAAQGAAYLTALADAATVMASF